MENFQELIDITKEDLDNLSVEELADLKIELDDLMSRIDYLLDECNYIINN